LLISARGPAARGAAVADVLGATVAFEDDVLDGREGARIGCTLAARLCRDGIDAGRPARHPSSAAPTSRDTQGDRDQKARRGAWCTGGRLVHGHPSRHLAAELTSPHALCSSLEP